MSLRSGRVHKGLGERPPPALQVRQQLFHDRLRVELDIVEGIDGENAANFAEVR